MSEFHLSGLTDSVMRSYFDPLVKRGALPGIQFVNAKILHLKESLVDSPRGCSAKKVGAYLAFRVISYSCIPTALNLLSALLSLVLAILTSPTRLCGKSLNDWCWKHFLGSFEFFGISLFDLTYDFRRLTGSCCCDPESQYLAI